MTKLNQVYKCEVCGNMVEIVHAAGGLLTCCGQPMTQFEEKKEDAGMEKHVPVVTAGEAGTDVAVGSIPHPMEAGHYIEWIEIVSDDGVCRKNLKPGDEPKVHFAESGSSGARAYCNLHGLWVS